MANGSFMAECNTFDLPYSLIDLESHVGHHFEWPLKTGFTLTTETYFWLRSYKNKAIDVIKFGKHFLNSTTDTQYSNGLKTLLQQGIVELMFYGDLVYKFKKIVGKPNFSDQFKKIIKRYKKSWI